MIKLTEKELMRRVEAQCNNMQFYRINALNYTGRTEKGEPYSEVLASWLCNMSENDQKELLLQHSLMKDDKKETGTDRPIQEERGKITFSEGSNRDEENIAKRMMQPGGSYVSNYDGTRIVDYQVPINRRSGSGEGKADLILVNDNKKETIIGELKDMDSPETLLRAMVEARTYQIKVTEYSFVHDRFRRCYQYDTIRPAVLIFEGTQPWTDYLLMRSKITSPLKKLASDWNMLIFKVRRPGRADAEIKDCVFEIELV